MGRNASHPSASSSVAFAVSVETIIALPLAGGLSHIQVAIQASSCGSEKGRRSRNGRECLQMALKSAGLNVFNRGLALPSASSSFNWALSPQPSLLCPY